MLFKKFYNLSFNIVNSKNLILIEHENLNKKIMFNKSTESIT